MHNLILISLFIFSFVCSSGTTKNAGDDPKKENKPGDTKPTDNKKQLNGLNDKQTIIPATEKMEWAFGRNYKPFTPTLEDIQAAEDILRACYKKEVTGTVNPFFGRKLEDYHRQFVGGEKENGEKIIYINCFCYVNIEYFKTWKTDLIMVDDGGNCFFNVKANLDKNEYYELMVNGLP
ncbi:MAG: hypothetical protein ABI543_07905 [Ignavibacteria bacterium]